MIRFQWATNELVLRCIINNIFVTLCQKPCLCKINAFISHKCACNWAQSFIKINCLVFITKLDIHFFFSKKPLPCGIGLILLRFIWMVWASKNICGKMFYNMSVWNVNNIIRCVYRVPKNVNLYRKRREKIDSSSVVVKRHESE